MIQNTHDPEESESDKMEPTINSEPSAELLSRVPYEPSPPSSPNKAQANLADQDKKDFITGLIVSLAINGVTFTIYMLCLGFESFALAEGGNFMGSSFFGIFGGIWLLINLIVLTIMALKRQDIMKGMVAGYGLFFFITLVIGIALTGACTNWFNW